MNKYLKFSKVCSLWPEVMVKTSCLRQKIYFFIRGHSITSVVWRGMGLEEFSI
jgi:hypothetical protein